MQISKGSGIKFVNSMRGKLLLFFLALSLIPLIIVSVFAFLQSQTALREKTTEQLQMAAKNNSVNIIDWLESRKKDLIVMSSNARIQSMDPDAAKSAIDQFFAGWGRYETMFVVGLDGKSIATNDNKPLDLSERDYVKEALTDKVVISQPVFSQATGNLIMVIASPVKSDGKVVGVSGATVPMTYIAQLMSSAALGNTGEAYLINSDGFFITPSRYEEKLLADGRIKEMAELELQIDTFASQQALAGNEGLSEYTSYHGTRVIGAYSWLPEQKWGIIVEQDDAEAFAAVYNLRNVIIGLIVISLIAIIILAIIIVTFCSAVSVLLQ